MSLKKILLIMLIASLIVFSFASTVGHAEPQTNANRVCEINELRESNVKAYQLDNGHIQCEVYATDIHYMGEDGTFEDIDNSITGECNLEGYKYTNRANSFHTYFADNLGKERAVVIQKDKYSIAFNVVNPKSNSPVKRSDILNDTASVFDKIISEDNRAVVYENVFDDVDIAYTVMTSGLKENIILRSKNAPDTYEFNIQLDGLKLVDKNGIVSFLNTCDEEIFYIPQMYMEDANEKYSEDIKYYIIKNDSGYNLRMTVDDSFLNAPDTVFPVVIDPDFTTTGPDYTSDTYICDEYPTTNYYLNSRLRTGRDTPYGARRSFIRFKLPSGYEKSGITEATFRLKLYSKGSGTNSLRLKWVMYEPDYFVWENDDYWRSNEIDWNNQPTNDYLDMTYLSDIDDNWYYFDVLSEIQECYDQSTPNFGFVLLDLVEGDTNTWCTFYSSDSGSYLPELSITYTEITDYMYYSNVWYDGVSDDLDIYVHSDANTYFGSAINSVWNLWNGIDPDLNIDSKSTTGDPADYDIEILTSDDFEDPHMCGETQWFNSAGERTYPIYGDGWSHVKIYLNIDSDSLQSMHLDLQKEVVLHELGHAIGLRHVDAGNDNSSVCIMQQRAYYCYPSPTSHDRQTVDAKY